MTNDITILSCPQCGFPKIRDCDNGLYQCDDCGTHFDKNENIVLTNEEWFCQLPTKDKAKFLEAQQKHGGTIASRSDVDWEVWLKEKHSNE